MEFDLYGAQKKVWKMLQKQKKNVNDFNTGSNLGKQDWETYFRELYKSDNANDNYPESVNFNQQEIQFSTLEIKEAISRLKNRKSCGPDGIYNELLKYAGDELHEHLQILLNTITVVGSTPLEWKDSITIPIFKKGDKKAPDNYRGITLLNTTLKLLTHLIKNRLEDLIEIEEEQQGFRKNRSTVDAIFILRQIVEKSIEFNHPAYLCFVDLSKAFDRVKKTDIIEILNEANVPEQLTRIIYEINSENTTKIMSAEGLTDTINVCGGIRQGDSLSPFLFNLIMNRIIKAVKEEAGYNINNKTINILCYADDAVLIADNEDDLQRLIHKFNITAKKYNMEISSKKTKSMVISKLPRRCKLEVDGASIEQVMRFNYLGVDITSFRDLVTEVQTQSVKATRTAGSLRETVWRNKFMRKEAKVKIYKTMIRPILTYATETRAETKRTKQIMRTTEMKVLRSIVGVTLRDRRTSKSIREECGIQDAVKWTKIRKKEWNDHVDRMGDRRLAHICKIGRPISKRPPGRPPKRWAQSWFSSSTE